MDPEKRGSEEPEGLPNLIASGARRTGLGLLFFRVVIPILCVGVLLGLLGVIYRYASTPPVVEAPTIPESSKAPTYEELKGEYMGMVTRGIETLKGFSGAKYRGSEEAVSVELEVFQAWALLINEMDNYPLTPEEAQVVRSVAQRVSDIQVREFPAMRAEFARTVGQTLRRFGVYASTTGDRHQNLHVTCLPAGGEEGINRALLLLERENVVHLRFVKTQFTFTRERTLTATMKPSKAAAPSDSRLVFWRGKEYQLVEW
jgi:hypothetical protein